MISTRPGSPGHRVLVALVALGDCTADDLAGRLVVLPPLTPEEARSPRRLDLLRERQRQRSEERARISRVLGRLQEQGLVAARSPARVSGEWMAQAAKRGPVGALRCMSCWRVREDRAAPYLALISRVETQPGCVGALSGQDGERYRQLVAWDVIVAPSLRRATAAGRALVEGA